MKALESVAIRRGEPSDHTALRGIIESAHAIRSHRIDGLPVLLGGTDHFVYLAETARPFGFVGAGAGEGDFIGDDVGEVMALFIHPDFQGYGMGRKLLVRGLSVLKRRGFGRALAFVPDGAEETFEAVGFELASGLSRQINIGTKTVTERGLLVDLDAFF